jgi:hypothetical protein
MTPRRVVEFYGGFDEHITSIFRVEEYAEQPVATYVNFYRLHDVTSHTPL